MTRRASYYIRWNGGALGLVVAGDTMTIRGENMTLYFEPRSVIVEGGYTYKRNVEDRNRRTVFIGFADELKPLSPPRVDIVGRNYVGNFEVIYTDLEFEHYLTVITPASFLYDYFVITSRDLMLYMQAKRKVYFEEEPYDKIIIYIA
ncbi:hypothetical protein [Hyperthermus butylicus]|uniref:Uncharacterized protein n=1 Tax=Hyperthermus butylicus (strain DSM 5456 / JCM 9403 / PLM1-5) TaxID=415426 RepID=A2BL45_HYPBU|nr:hypothetical protein [Hyperthermus butylicus]ABM80706.1 hypothetical protein Hbut_0855 [Hyperthermus butylicus DSM 5456]